MPLRKILSIEAIRGFAAIYVLLGHSMMFFQPYVFCPQYEFIIKAFFGFAHQAVILFFIVSGFSIHYSSPKEGFNTRKSISEYFYKRIRRIYPLFLFSLLIACVVLVICQMDASIKRVVLSFFFLTDIAEGSIALPIPTNFPIWSLSYEIPYYLLYPVLIKVINKFGMQKTFIFSIVISLFAGAFYFLQMPNHLSNILQLYWAWVGGAYIADLILNNKKVNVSFLSGGLIFLLAFSFTFEKISLLRDWAWTGAFLLVFMSFFQKSSVSKLYEKIINVCVGLLGIYTCYLLSYNEDITFHGGLLRYILLFFILLLFILQVVPFYKFQPFIRWFLKPFTSAGSYSYALYIFHWPVLTLIIHLFQKFIFENVMQMALVTVLTLVFIFIFSWFLELKVQPLIARRLNKLYY